MMGNDHIIELIDRNPKASMGAEEISLIESHTGTCSGCREAYLASSVSSALIRARASEEIVPSQFFRTRVMAAVREAQPGRTLSFGRFWRAAGVLVSSMLAVVAILTTLTLFASQDTNPAGQPAMVSMEQVLMDEADSTTDENVSDSQVIDAVFNTGGANGSN